VRVLVVGIGSIGARHTANLLSLGYNNISLVSGKAVLDEPLKYLKKYKSIEEALIQGQYDVAVICTPASFHVKDAIKILDSGIPNIYIEKPVNNTWDDVEELLQLSKAKNARIIIGYDLHFDPGIQAVKELISTEQYGKPLSANAIVGQYLPDWRPKENFAQGSSAKKDTGGGVLLDLIHEFDYLYWFFGNVSTVAAFHTSGEILKIETEEIADVLLKFQKGITATVHLDYMQPSLIRQCLITCTKGSIYLDMAKRELRGIDNKKQETFYSYKDFERNDRFKLIMKAFLENEKDSRLTSLEQGLESLKIALAVKKSCLEQKFIQP
jgi:predicted dehydrogenase